MLDILLICRQRVRRLNPAKLRRKEELSEGVHFASWLSLFLLLPSTDVQFKAIDTIQLILLSGDERKAALWDQHVASKGLHEALRAAWQSCTCAAEG